MGGQEHEPKENETWFVPLTYDIKKECKDNEDYPQNYCDYMVLPRRTRDNEKDWDALNYYKRHNGVPYYISDPNVSGWGGKLKYNKFIGLNETVLNWYSYRDDPLLKPNSPDKPKPNTIIKKGIGLDCSGLIMNCLLDIRYNGNNNTNINYNDNDRFFKGKSEIDEDSYRDKGEDAYELGSKRSRLIPLDDTYKNGNDLLVQAGDLIYSQKTKDDEGRHIALCVIDLDETPNLDNHLTIDQKNDKYFNIIHNYGGTRIYTNSDWFSDGFFCKTLKGPFRHWGVALDNEEGWPHSFVGRIYLWY
ncbi:MAG: hypothetical protein LBV17_10860 [Treponema sp.]|jgi:hypothetical protein|nr:hypothetical protein [Treponema sp.]